MIKWKREITFADKLLSYAGTIGACLLKAAYGIDGDEALQRVQRSFGTRNEMNFDGTLRKSPETSEQLQFVRSFQYVI